MQEDQRTDCSLYLMAHGLDGVALDARVDVLHRLKADLDACRDRAGRDVPDALSEFVFIYKALKGGGEALDLRGTACGVPALAFLPATI